MEKRQRLDAELEEVHKQLAQIGTGASVLQPSRRASSIDPEDESPDEAEKRIVTPGRLTTAAFQLAGYVVATALGRSIQARSRSERMPNTTSAAARKPISRPYGQSVIWPRSGRAARAARGSRGRASSSSRWKAMVAVHFATTGRSQPGRRSKPPSILNESWDDIVRLARLLAEGRTLSRAEIEAELEAEVFRLSELKDALGDGR